MSESDTPWRQLANFAGFLFQIRVGYEIERLYRDNYSHCPGVLHQEHRVKIADTGEEVFIDFVLKKNQVIYVVECKRFTKGRWLFLSPDNKRQALYSRLLWSSHGTPNLIGWDEFILRPATPQAAFCVTDRNDQNRDARLLETIAGHLAKATEALAAEYVWLDKGKTVSREDFVYVPLIITNASLATCYFDPAAVDLDEGELPSGSGEFEPCSMVKFRKSLSTSFPLNDPTSELHSISGTAYPSFKFGPEDERTVLIMNVGAFDSVWSELRVGKVDEDFYPWEIARRQQNLPK